MLSVTTIATLLIAFGSAAPGDGRGYALEIALETSGPHSVVFTEHRGPYWSLGKAFSSMRQHMEAKAVSGPLFAQYLDDPGSAPLHDLRTRIGFFVDGETSAKVRSFYSTDFWPERSVAVVRVPEPRALLSRYGPALHRWAAEHDLRASGPMVEVYGCSDRPADVVCTELWLPVAPVEREVVRNAVEPRRASPEGTARENGIPTGRQRVPPGEDRWEQSPVEQWIETNVELPSGETDVKPPMTAESSKPMREARPKPDSVQPELEPALEAKAPAQTPETVVPIRERLHEMPETGRVDEPQIGAGAEAAMVCGPVVGDLFARPGALGDADRSWLAALVLRVRAAAKGVSRMYPGEDEGFIHLHEELADRFEAAYGAPAKDWARRDQSGEWRRFEGRQLLVQQMDRILGKIAYRLESPDMLLEEVCGVLEDAAGELSAAGR